MPWNGSGTFAPLITFIPLTPATATDQNAQDNDISVGITNCIAKDGQNAVSNNINWGGNRILNLGNPVNGSDGVNLTTLLSFGSPSGTVVMFSGAVIPSGWFICNGQALSRSTYSVLFGVIGITYGSGDGSTTFNIPNMQSRVPVGTGTGGGLSNYNLGNIGGAENITLSVSQLPSHTHTDSGHIHIATDNGHFHGGIPVASAFQVGISASAVHPVSGTGNSAAGFADITIGGGFANISSTGGSLSHENRQPYFGITFIIKT